MKMHRNVEWPKLPNELEVREENKRQSDCFLIGFFIIIKVTLISVISVFVVKDFAMIFFVLLFQQ
jgi:hypothetical protein